MSETEAKQILENDGEIPIEGHNQVIPDTVPPTADHGFLEQFQVLSAETYEKLKEIVSHGLTPDERVNLMKVTIKFFAVSMSGAKEEDFSPEAKKELELLLGDLEISLGLNML